MTAPAATPLVRQGTKHQGISGLVDDDQEPGHDLRPITVQITAPRTHQGRDLDGR
jgi:hypothetical protein